jgi:hypothetical protein
LSKRTGYTCDNPTCGTFVVSDSLPPGWVSLQVNTDDPQDPTELCSAQCLAALALERVDADGARVKGWGRVRCGKATTPYTVTEEGSAAKAAAARLSNHNRWHRDRGQANSDCVHCQEEMTAPGGVEPEPAAS